MAIDRKGLVEILEDPSQSGIVLSGIIELNGSVRRTVHNLDAMRSKEYQRLYPDFFGAVPAGDIFMGTRVMHLLPVSLEQRSGMVSSAWEGLREEKMAEMASGRLSGYGGGVMDNFVHTLEDAIRTGNEDAAAFLNDILSDAALSALKDPRSPGLAENQLKLECMILDNIAPFWREIVPAAKIGSKCPVLSIGEMAKSLRRDCLQGILNFFMRQIWGIETGAPLDPRAVLSAAESSPVELPELDELKRRTYSLMHEDSIRAGFPLGFKSHVPLLKPSPH